MDGTDKPHMYNYKEIKNNRNYEANCTLVTLLVSNLQNCECFISVAQGVQPSETKILQIQTQ